MTIRTRIAALCLTAVAASSAHAAGQASKPFLAPGAELRKLAGGLHFTEGPVWLPSGHLLFADVPVDAIMRWSLDGKVTVFRQPSGHANGSALDRQGRLITCVQDRGIARTEADGRIVFLAERYEGKRLNSPNDVAVRSDGSIYFTDPPYGIAREKEELGFYGVYRIAPGGAIRLLTRVYHRPNGLAFTPNEKQLYIGDTERNAIDVWDVRPDCSITNRRVFAEPRTPGAPGAADGMKVDSLGRLFSTGPEGVWVLAPDGKLLGKIPVPEVASNLAFGGPDYRTLFITARTGLYSIRLREPGIAPARRSH